MWAVRAANLDRVLGGGADDKLPARGKLGTDLKRLIDSGRLDLVLGFHAEGIIADGDGLIVTGERKLGPVDRIIVATGSASRSRPDPRASSRLRSVARKRGTLGPMIDPNLHSCGTVPPHGHRELAHPEPGYFAVGIKSYGRAPTFLMATGYEQVRSVAAHLAGDEAAARDVRLVLPETGVCSSVVPSPAAEAPGCCGGPAPSVVDACCPRPMPPRKRPGAEPAAGAGRRTERARPPSRRWRLTESRAPHLQCPVPVHREFRADHHRRSDHEPLGQRTFRAY